MNGSWLEEGAHPSEILHRGEGQRRSAALWLSFGQIVVAALRGSKFTLSSPTLRTTSYGFLRATEGDI